jgi:signal peptidase I
MMSNTFHSKIGDIFFVNKHISFDSSYKSAIVSIKYISSFDGR